MLKNKGTTPVYSKYVGIPPWRDKLPTCPARLGTGTGVFGENAILKTIKTDYNCQHNA